ncbi:MAG: S26 family signal peptidase [Acidimicrobiales bacterium]
MFADFAATPAATAVLDEPPVGDELDQLSDLDDEDGSVHFARDLLEWAAVLVAVVALALVFKAFLFQAFWIPTESMESTSRSRTSLCQQGELSPHDINRGRRLSSSGVPILDLADDIKDLIKRVIATSGDHRGQGRVIYIDGERLIEPYLDAGVARPALISGHSWLATGRSL